MSSPTLTFSLASVLLPSSTVFARPHKDDELDAGVVGGNLAVSTSANLVRAGQFDGLFVVVEGMRLDSSFFRRLELGHGFLTLNFGK